MSGVNQEADQAKEKRDRRQFKLDVLQAATDWSEKMIDNCANHGVSLDSISPDPRSMKAVYEHFMILLSPTF